MEIQRFEMEIRTRSSEELETELVRVRERINNADAYGWLADQRKLSALCAQRDALALELLRRQNAAIHAEP